MRATSRASATNNGPCPQIFCGNIVHIIGTTLVPLTREVFALMAMLAEMASNVAPEILLAVWKEKKECYGSEKKKEKRKEKTERAFATAVNVRKEVIIYAPSVILDVPETTNSAKCSIFCI